MERQPAVFSHENRTNELDGSHGLALPAAKSPDCPPTKKMKSLPLKRILLAEDSVLDAELTLNVFEEYHLAQEVVVVRDGAEALDYLYQRGEFAGIHGGRPIVVILDLKMPKVDGLEVLRRMRADPVLKCVPVVMLTSSREDQDLVQSYQLGANAYVVKPVESQEFLASIRQLGIFWAKINEPPPGATWENSPDPPPGEAGQ
jgi:CheY-like chemotaxis protein